MAGGRDFEKGLILISDTLEKMGHKVVTKDNVVRNEFKDIIKRTRKERERIMERDKKRVRNCDAFIAEVSTYSHGVGYEHRYAEENNKPILFLRDKSLSDKEPSAFHDGTIYKKFMFFFYNEKNIKSILKKFFIKYGK